MPEGILAESNRRFLEARARFEEQFRKRKGDCERIGKHDTSKGEFEYIIGTIHASLSVQGCRVGIRVAGECPNCRTHYERRPTREEMATEEYREMAEQLDTYESIEERMHQPMTI